MRRYDDPVEVRRVDDEPEQFLWRGRLFKVRTVLARWVETGAWWQGERVSAVLGVDETGAQAGTRAGTRAGARTGTRTGTVDLLGEREVWRVEAGRGLGPRGESVGVFDLCFDWNNGCWRLVGCED